MIIWEDNNSTYGFTKDCVVFGTSENASALEN